jgi:hypothetical protein
MSGPLNDNAAPPAKPIDLDAPGPYELPLCFGDFKLLLGEDIAAIEATTLEGAVVRLPFARDGLEVLGRLVAVALTDDTE